MRVCMLVRNTIAHDGRVKGEAQALNNAGHQVTIIGIWRPGFARREDWQGIHLIRIPPLFERLKALAARLLTVFCRSNAPGTGSFQVRDNAPPSSARPSSLRNIRFALREGVFEISQRLLTYQVRLAARSIQADVYHAHDLDMLEEAWDCARQTDARLVYDSHELWARDYLEKRTPGRGGPDRWVRREQQIAPHADLVITVSEPIADMMARNLNLPRSPAVVRNCAPYREYLKGDRLRRECTHTSVERPIILYQGGILPGRGLELFLKIATRVHRADFVMIGPAGQEDFTASFLPRASKVPNLYYHGSVPYEELWDFTRSADIGFACIEPLWKSYRYALTNKMFEYMVAGLPVLASDIPGHRDFLQRLPPRNRPLILIPHDDPEEAASRLNALLDNPSHVCDLGRQANALTRTRFNRESEMKQLVLAYKSLAPKSRSKTSR